MLKEVNNKDNINLICDNCESSNIIDTNEGYTCQTCGIVLQHQKFSEYIPYGHEMKLHPNLSSTQIGTWRERMQYSSFNHLEKLNRLYLKKNYQEWVYEQARLEISRIFTWLELSGSLKEIVFSKFRHIYKCLNPRTKYMNPEKLVPVTIYFCLKSYNISINESELLEISKISKKEFNAFKLQIYDYFPHFAERDRKAYILGLVG